MPLQIRPDLSDAGTHPVIIEVTDRKGGKALLQFSIIVSNLSVDGCLGGAGLLYDRWVGASPEVGLNGFTPTFTSKLVSFEMPANVGENFTARLSGYVCAPETGDYVFEMSADQLAELWISTDFTKQNLRLIASGGPTDPLTRSLLSAPIRLQEGTNYYIEARLKETSGNDHLSVGWQLPSGVSESPIPGTRLAPASGLSPSSEDRTPPQPPVGLALQMAQPNEIRLAWTSNDEPDWAGYTLYRSQVPGVSKNTAQFISGLLSNSAYSDQAVVPGQTYYYTVTASDTAGNESLFSNELTVVVPQQPVAVRTFQVNLHTAATGTLPAWNVLRATSITGNRSVALRTTAGTGTTVTATIYHQSEGSDVPGASTNTGFSNGVYPNEVIQSVAWTTSTGKVRLSGLDPSNTYRLTLYGGRAVTGPRLTNYTVNGQVKTLDCANNTRNTVTFEGMVPDASGVLWVAFAKGTGSSYGYLSAMVIEEAAPANQRLSAGAFETSSMPAGQAYQVYPNPFSEMLQLGIEVKESSLVQVELLDIMGRKAFSWEKALDTGAHQLDFGADVVRLPTGIYILHLKINGQPMWMKKLTKE